jgi:mxaL protein
MTIVQLVHRSLRRGPRFWILLAASLALALTALRPSALLPRESYGFLFVLDITQSMNTPDAGGSGEPLTRLAAAKGAVRAALPQLPCGSEAGLAVFTEYRSFLLLAPVEVCSGYAELLATLDRLDWRMAWVGASEVSKGLRFALDIARALEPRPSLVFLTDGHEAPPVNPILRAPVDNGKDSVRGLIVGVGGDALSPIPKFDMDGKPLGYWAADEVMQTDVFSRGRATSVAGEGMVENEAGPAAASGTEHLSSLKEAYLKSLAAEADLRYVRLTSPGALLAALRQPVYARSRPVTTDLRWVLAAAALLALAAAFAPFPLAGNRTGRG